MRFIGFLCFFVFADCSVAGEVAVLTSGARIGADRHEISGGVARLYTPTGWIELESQQIERFEAGAPASAAVPPAPASVQVTPLPAPSPQELVDAAADRYGLPRHLVRSVVRAESGFQTGAVSPKGAMGLMQLMPATAQALGANPADPAQNVDAGTRYLRDLLVKYNGLLYHALAAYNAGPDAVDRYNGLPPYRETQNYVSRIAEEFKRNRQQP